MKMFSSEIFHNFQSTAHYEMSHSRTFSPYHITEWTITQHNITPAELHSSKNLTTCQQDVFATGL